MNIEDAKRDLPNVRVKMPNGTTFIGKVTGRKNRFPTVSVLFSECGEFSFQTSWAQIARKATDGTSITYF